MFETANEEQFTNQVWSVSRNKAKENKEKDIWFKKKDK